VLLPLLGLLVGVLAGLVLNVNVGFELSRYSAVAILAALDSVLGAVRAELDGVYNNRIFISGFVTNAIVAVILTFIGVIVTSLGLVRERQEGTLEQLAVMPFRPFDVIGGKIAPYFVFAAVDMVLVTVLGVILFDVPFNGSVVVFALGSLLFLLVLVGLGG